MNKSMESSWSKPFPSCIPQIPVLVWSPFRSVEISPFENSMLTVPVPPFQRAAVRRMVQALSREVPRPIAAGVDEMYMGKQPFNIFEMQRLALCNNTRLSREYLSGTPALVQEPSWSRKVDHRDSGTLSRSYSASLSVCLVVEVMWDE